MTTLTQQGAGLPAEDIEAIAAEAFSALGSGRQIAPFAARYPRFDLASAYRVTAAVHARRLARGERPVGRKIGFTNRTIWAEYGVHAPIWGYMYDSTVHELATAGGGFALVGLAEPRIEPEIVFGLGRAPEPDMDDAALLGCIDWLAHGFEIVQSPFPAWKFAAADTIAAYGLHGALLVGPRHAVSAGDDDWLRQLAGFAIDLYRDGVLVDQGTAANVLDSPLLALRHLARVLTQDAANPPLAPGEIVTTGTLTRAFPVVSGETWTTVLSGLPLAGIELRLA